jgi:hypothetical protein
MDVPMVFREVAPTEAVPTNNQSNVPKKSQKKVQLSWVTCSSTVSEPEAEF